MNRYIKRIEILLICICVIFTCLPVRVDAAEAEYVYITIGQYNETIEETKHVQVNVIKCQGDFLFSGEDISSLTGYEYSTNSNIACFTRGDKTIEIDIEKGILQEPGKLSAVKLGNPVVSSNDMLYFPAAYLFPWLNVTCFEEAGVLYIVPDMVSVWDFIDDFDSEKGELLFDITACCQQLNIDSKWLQASSYVKSNLISGMFKDMVWIPFSEHTYGTYRDYYDIFEEMFEQKNSTLETFEEIVDNGKKISASFSFIEAVDKDADIPDEFQVFREAGKVLSDAGKALDFAIFFHSFYQDNTEKLMWMDSISGNRENYDYPDAMLSAAFDIQTSYGNEWKDGVLLKIVQKWTDDSFDKLIEGVTGEGIAKAILKGIGFYGELVPDWNEGISNVGYYNEIASCGINVYEESRKYGFTDIYDIEQRRAHASLYLYASAKNWETMYDYAVDNGYEDLAEEYQAKADAAYEWLGKFIASSSATVNDSFRYADGRMKEKYTEELEAIFSRLLIDTTAEQEIEAKFDDYYLIDMAIMAKFMSEGGEIYSCELQDVNQDGYRELCMEKYLLDNIHLSQYVIGTWKDPGICIYTDQSAAGSTSMLLSEENVYLNQSYVTADYIRETDWIYMDNVWEEVSETSKDISKRTLDNCFDDIVRISIEESTDNVCGGLEKFWNESGRKYYRTCYDMNGDGKEDVVYAIGDYFVQWRNNINTTYARGDELNLLPDDDVLISLCDTGHAVELQIDIGSNLLPILSQNNFDTSALNSYLSFFLDYWLEGYTSSNPDYQVLLEFVHNYLIYSYGGPDKIVFEGAYDVILKSDVDKLLEFYFGITVPCESVGNIQYGNGKFYYPSTGNGMYGMRLAIYDEIEERGNGEYKISFYDVYVSFEDYESGETNPLAFDEAAYYDYNIEQVREDKYCEILGKRSCIIKWKDNRFIVLDYQHLNESEGATAINEENVVTITVEVVDNNGEKATYETRTDAEYLRQALEELDDATDFAIAGEESEYGLCITTVNGVTADFNVDGAYWSVYVNGEYGMYGVDTQPVADGDTYSLVYEKYEAE